MQILTKICSYFCVILHPQNYKKNKKNKSAEVRFSCIHNEYGSKIKEDLDKVDTEPHP